MNIASKKKKLHFRFGAFKLTKWYFGAVAGLCCFAGDGKVAEKFAETREKTLESKEKNIM